MITIKEDQHLGDLDVTINYTLKVWTEYYRKCPTRAIIFLMKSVELMNTYSGRFFIPFHTIEKFIITEPEKVTGLIYEWEKEYGTRILFLVTNPHLDMSDEEAIYEITKDPGYLSYRVE